MSDPFAAHTPGLTAPASDARDVQPSDDADLPQAARALFIGGSGHVRVTMVSGRVVQLSNLQAGAIYPLRVTRVHQDGTTAQGIVALT